jgi:hypothetical protein
VHHAGGPHPTGTPVERSRPSIEVADIVARHGQQLSSHRVLSSEQRKALGAIESCRTARLGGHVDVCGQCGHQRPAYNSCRNRHCPKCQWLASERWLDRRMQTVLPVHHFHVVFTLPSELRALVMRNKKPLYGLLFESASRALKKLAADDRRLGAMLGITAVLHTWSRDLSFHPHVHCVVTGGGLTDDGRWVHTRPGFLLSVKPLSKLFRGIFLDRLVRLLRDEKLDVGGKCAALEHENDRRVFIDKLYDKSWNVYSKKSFGGAEAVHGYLSKYTHRIAISNRRLIAFDDDSVTFYTRDGRTASLRPLGFLSRFVNHVLPHNFIRIRHFGLYASSHLKTTLPRARALLHNSGAPAPTRHHEPPEPDDEPDFVRRFRDATGIDLGRCERCGAIVSRHPLAHDPRASPPQRAPPHAA